MGKAEYRYNRRCLALGCLVNLRYISRWIIFCADLFIPLCVSLIGVLGSLPIIYVYINGISVSRVEIAPFVASILSFLTLKVYHGVIRRSTLRGLQGIGGVAITRSILILILFHPSRANLNSSIYRVGGIANCMLTTALLITSHIFAINVYNSVLSRLGKKRKRILVLGVDKDSIMITASPNRQVLMQSYSIISLLTFGSARKNLHIAGLPVYQIKDIDDLSHLIPRNSLDGIPFPSIKTIRRERDRLTYYYEQTSLKPFMVPDMEEIHESGIKRSVRDTCVGSLLGRKEISINLGEVGLLLEDKTILVMGVAGSTGSKICRQLVYLPVRKLICPDVTEAPMHDLRLRLEKRYKELDFVPIIGDVRNPDRVDYILRSWYLQAVFHAAAYEYAPLMEESPCGAVYTSVFDTRVIMDAVINHDVEKFMVISTDKAVNPTNIMGCSRCFTEIYVQSLSMATGGGALARNIKFTTTRLGNVLGSNGSVVPRLRDQITKGDLVTVIHPDITRHFMTVPGAYRLVSGAGAMSKGGKISILDMGEPVKIAGLARRTIKLSGLQVDEDIGIRYTGLRPGGKLYKELLSNKGSTKETLHEKIRVVAVRECAYKDVAEHISLLAELSPHVYILPMVRKTKSFVPELKSQNSQFMKLDGAS